MADQFHLHRMLVAGVSEDTEYKLRFVWGTGTMADGITAGQVSAVMIKFDKTNPQQSAGVPYEVKAPDFEAGTKVWAQCKNATNNATLDFYVAYHLCTSL